MSYHKIDKQPAPNASRETHLATRYPNPPKLKHGDDTKRAKELNKLIKDAESGLVRILKVGFFLECLAEDLPHGMLGPWVESHCNRKWRTVQRWKQVAAGVGDVLGISLKQRLEYKLHEVLALPLKKVPAELLAVREKIDAEIAGKSYRQLFLELKQVDEEDPTKPKRGRMKGQGGASKEQRERARLAEEEEKITALTLACEEHADWLMDNSDDERLGKAGVKDSAEFKKLVEAVTYFNAWLKNANGKWQGGEQ